MPTAALSTRTAEFVVLTAELPGRGEEPIGVLLADPAAGLARVRLRRDWDDFAGEDAEVLELLEADWNARAQESGPAFLDQLEDAASNAVRISAREQVLVGNFDAALQRLYRQHVPVPVRRFETHLPLYSCRAAAGRFGDLIEVEEEGWIEAPGLRLREGMFVADVTGRSMEPQIPDGSLCVFRAPVAGSRHGKLVLVENLDESDAGGQRYTVKRYHRPPGERAVTMQPLNPDFQPWAIDEDLAAAGRIRVLAEFVAVLR